MQRTSQSILVPIEGGEIEVLVNGEGPAIVLLPSLGRSANDFDEIAPMMARKGLRVVRPQPRGIGQSKGPGDGIDMRDLAQDIALVIKAVCPTSAFLAGHAFGNFVARAVATYFPQVVRAVALVAASPGWIPSGESPYDPEVDAAVYACSDLSLPEEERIRLLQLAFFAPGNDPRAWLFGWYPETKALQRRAQLRTPIEDIFAAGTAPLLYLQAYDDTVAQRKFAHVLKDTLGDRVTEEVIYCAGHALLPEQPQAVVESLSRWVLGDPTGRPGGRTSGTSEQQIVALRTLMTQHHIQLPAQWEHEFLPEYDAMLLQMAIVARAVPQQLEPTQVFRVTPPRVRSHD